HAGRDEAGRRQSEIVVWSVLVTGYLPLNEGVIGQIVVECLNDEVAVVIGGGAVVVMLEAVALRETGDVEPVTGPALAVVDIAEEAVEQFVKRIRGSVAQESVHFVRCRRQAEKIEVGSPYQLPFVNRRVRRQAGGFQFGKDEPIRDRATPAFILDRRRRRAAKWLERPEPA